MPHDTPRLPEYGTGFVLGTLRQRHAVESLVFGRARFARALHEVWVSYEPGRPPRHRAWQTKLYVCVRARYYWRTIRELIYAANALDTHWKFYMAPTGYERPDKIVFYPAGRTDLQHLIRKLQPILRGGAGHPLRHACLPTDLGLASGREGMLYIGCDPRFLDESWRQYRSLVNAWANLNQDYLDQWPGGQEGWLAAMNLSARHEGPASLEPKVDTAFVRRFYAVIIGKTRSASQVAATALANAQRARGV